MKANRLILSVVIALISAISITAHEIIPVDSTHLLSDEQKQTLNYTKKLFDATNGSIMIPLEATDFLGKPKESENEITIIPEWTLAYFENDNDCNSLLYVPLKINYNESNLISELRVLFNNNTFYRMLITSISFMNNNNEHTIILYSTIDGGAFLCEIYQNNQLIEEIKGMSNNSGIIDISFRENSAKKDVKTNNDTDIMKCFNILKNRKPQTNSIK